MLLLAEVLFLNNKVLKYILYIITNLQGYFNKIITIFLSIYHIFILTQDFINDKIMTVSHISLIIDKKGGV